MKEFEQNVLDAIREEEDGTVLPPRCESTSEVRVLPPEVRERYAQIGITNGPMQDWFHELVIQGVKNELKYIKATAAQEVHIQTLRVKDRICEWLEQSAMHAELRHQTIPAKAWREAAKAIKNDAPFSVRSKNQILAMRRPVRLGHAGVIPSTVFTEL